MGYTHYFKQIEELPKDKWNKFIEEVKTKLDDGQTMLRFEYNSNKIRIGEGDELFKDHIFIVCIFSIDFVFYSPKG